MNPNLFHAARHGLTRWKCMLSLPGFFLLLFLAVQARGETGAVPPSEPSDLTEMSLEALMDINVTSVSKKSQKLATAAAAVFVITQEDIKRSGVTTIADALRLAPGVQVARLDSNKWAVSIRGFNGRYANKLLVLMDGRSLYTPFFSGVYWEVQDTPLEDAHRLGVMPIERHQQQKSRCAFRQCSEGGAIMRPHDQIAFPVPGNRAIGHLDGSLMNTDHVGNLPAGLRTPHARLASRALPPQVVGQFRLERSLCLHVQVRVDRLVGDGHQRLSRKRAPNHAGDLLGRPMQLQRADDNLSHEGVFVNFPDRMVGGGTAFTLSLCAKRRVFATLVCMAVHLPADRGGWPSQIQGDLMMAAASGKARTDMLEIVTSKSRVVFHGGNLPLEGGVLH